MMFNPKNTVRMRVRYDIPDAPPAILRPDCTLSSMPVRAFGVVVQAEAKG